MYTVGVALLRAIMRRIGRSATALRRFIQVMSVLHLLIYRATGGFLGGKVRLRTAQILLLTTRGRKTGKARTVPLLTFQDARDWIIIASHGGLDQPPAWWLNLQHDPQALVQIGRRKLRVWAEQADEANRERLWQRFVREFPGYEDYRRRTSRRIPIVILHPADERAERTTAR